mgnify:CR=1 FL=1
MYSTKRITVISLLASLAIALSIVESFIPSLGIPGVKLGLANVIILIALYGLGIKDSIYVNILRIVMSAIIRGTIFGMGFFMSLSGAVFSLLIMIVFYKFFY